MEDWRPSAAIPTLQLRARLLQQIRAFFAARAVLEVETPALSRAATPDPHIESFRSQALPGGAPRYLHTSPEFAMKRLLAAGSGAIYQLARVFRQGELGRRHNPEFTLLEWYRPGYDLHGLMQEVDELLRSLLDATHRPGPTRRLSYRQAFLDYAGIDPFTATSCELAARAAQLGIAVQGLTGTDPDPWRDLLLTEVVEPALPGHCPVFIYDYPASQAALAQVRPARGTEPAVAERFELYYNGLELANGFHELQDAAEQRRRFEQDNRARQRAGQAPVPLDEALLAALEAGLPDCAGVAVGVDRLVMLAAGAETIAQVLAFDFPRA